MRAGRKAFERAADVLSTLDGDEATMPFARGLANTFVNVAKSLAFRGIPGSKLFPPSRSGTAALHDFLDRARDPSVLDALARAAESGEKLSADKAF